MNVTCLTAFVTQVKRDIGHKKALFFKDVTYVTHVTCLSGMRGRARPRLRVDHTGHMGHIGYIVNIYNKNVTCLIKKIGHSKVTASFKAGPSCSPDERTARVRKLPSQ